MSDVTFLVKGLNARLIFTGPLTIAQVSETRSALIELMKALPHQQVWLDIEGIHEADSAGVQVLLSFARYLKSENRVVELIGCSDAVYDAAWALGVASDDDCLGVGYATEEEEVA